MTKVQTNNTPQWPHYDTFKFNPRESKAERQQNFLANEQVSQNGIQSKILKLTDEITRYQLRLTAKAWTGTVETVES